MTDLVDQGQIEQIVGVARDDLDHWAKAVSAEQTVYLMHPRSCLAEHADLRGCEFSLALDNGIDPSEWREDEPLLVEVCEPSDGNLVYGQHLPRLVPELR